MLFIAGLKAMSKEEKIALLAASRSLSASALLGEKASAAGLKIKDKVLGFAEKAVRKFDYATAQRIKQFNRSWKWEADTLRSRHIRELELLQGLDESELEDAMKEELARLSGTDPMDSTAKAAEALLVRVGTRAGVAWTNEEDPLSYERKVVKACIEQIALDLQRKMKTMTRKEIDELQKQLDEIISGLGQREKEAIIKAAQLSDISGESVLRFWKTTSGVVLAQLVLSSSGFGVYLMLTTIMKAFSLFWGVTFPFAVYTTATGVLSFLLSGPFLIAVITGLAGLTFLKTQNAIDFFMGAMYIITGYMAVGGVTDESEV